jgi:SagB-type dehydrogenase family enzyme
MKKYSVISLLVLVFFVSALFLSAEEMKPIQLKKPEFGKKPVLDILAKRQSMREYSTKPLPVEVLSELLWAACGINREDGKRTAPTAMNMQEIDVYAVMADGAYFYDAKENVLKPVVMKDLREATGKQAFVKDAPLNIVLVADFAKMTRGTEEDKRVYAGMDASFVSENIYFYCAAEGLATVVRAMVDRDALAKALNLRPDQKVILAQTVGYPKN